MFGGLPTASVAMNQAGFSVCATVEKDPSFVQMVHTCPSERINEDSQVLNYSSADLLSQAVLKGDVRLPCISIVHARSRA